MRSRRLGVALLLCLAVAGCAGAGRTSPQPGGPSQTLGVMKVVGTPGPEETGVNDLLKAAAERRAVAPTPTPVATPEGPMSCLQQRMNALREGKLLPTNACQ